MLSLFNIALVSSALAAPAIDHEAVLARRGKDNWWSGLEPYDTYHARYLLNGCSKGQYSADQKVQAYWYQCCQPLLASQTAADLPSTCQPGGVYGIQSTSTSAAVAQQTDAPAAAVPAAAPADVTSAAPVDQAPSSSDVATPDPTTSADVAPTSTQDAVTPDAAPTTSAVEAAASPSTGSGQTFAGHATYFYQNGNPGACGNYNSDSATIIALDSAMYSQDLCGKGVMITRTSTGQQIYATVADECPTCDSAQSIDLSVGAFTALAQEWEGMVDVTWTWA